MPFRKVKFLPVLEGPVDACIPSVSKEPFELLNFEGVDYLASAKSFESGVAYRIIHNSIGECISVVTDVKTSGIIESLRKMWKSYRESNIHGGIGLYIDSIKEDYLQYPRKSYV